MIAALGGYDGVTPALEWWQEGRSHPIAIRADSVGPAIDWWLAGMRRHGVDLLYVHRSALEGLGLPAKLEVPAPGERRPRHPWVDGVSFEGQRVSHSALAPSLECGELEVLIGAYQDGAGDPFEAAADARELLAATVAFRDAFKAKGRARGWAYRNSAIQTGWKLMHAPWSRGARRARLAALADENPLPTLEGAQGLQVEVPYGGRWAREVCPSCQPGDSGCAVCGDERPPGGHWPYVLAWDVNAQRLAATGRLSLGVGGLERIDWRDAGAGFDPKLPGYHLVSSIEHPYAGLIPPIFEPGWHTTPRIAMARHLGIDFELERSHVWTQHVPYLNPFYEAMRDARGRLLEGMGLQDGATQLTARERASAIALGALKQSYLQPLGRLRSTRARDQGSPHYRPDWYDHVIGQELAREYLRLHQLAELGVPVLAVYFDTIIIEAETPDPIAGAPPPLEVSGQLGKFKPLGVLPTEAAHAALYGGERNADVGALVKALKAAGVSTNPAPPAGPPTALSALTRPTHGGYSPPPTLEAALLELARQGVSV